MGSDRGNFLIDTLRRLHTRGLEAAEWIALFIVGVIASGGPGYNLFQLIAHGRFYVMVRRGQNYWAYWPIDAGPITTHSLFSACFLLFGVWALATTMIYPLLILRWGPSSPAYLQKPPLNIAD